MSAAGLGGSAERAPARGATVWLVPVGGALLALLAGPLTLLAPTIAVAFVLGAGVVVLVAVHPPAAGYILLAATPLVVGIDRGRVIPVLRPSEAVAGIVLAGLAARGLYEVIRGCPLRVSTTSVDRSLVVLAFTGSVMPLLWMLARGNQISVDDALYALQIWKYVLVFLIIRVSIRREEQVRVCLAIALATACVVGAIAILQSLSLFGVPGLLAGLYAPDADVAELDVARGTSTLASSLAVADVMLFSAAISLAWAIRSRPARPLLLAIGAF